MTKPEPTNPGTISRGQEWRFFAFLAVVVLPALMLAGIAAYGFVVWFLQILFFGPPGA